MSQECQHLKTETLSHEFFPDKIICKSCNKTINGQWSGNTNVEEFENS